MIIRPYVAPTAAAAMVSQPYDRETNACEPKQSDTNQPRQGGLPPCFKTQKPMNDIATTMHQVGAFMADKANRTEARLLDLARGIDALNRQIDEMRLVQQDMMRLLVQLSNPSPKIPIEM